METPNNAERYARDVLDTLTTIVSAIDGDTDALEELETDDITDYLLSSYALEIVRQVGRPFEVLITFGGPNAWLECRLDGDGDRHGPARLCVAWGGEYAETVAYEVNRVTDWYVEASSS